MQTKMTFVRNLTSSLLRIKEGQEEEVVSRVPRGFLLPQLFPSQDPQKTAALLVAADSSLLRYTIETAVTRDDNGLFEVDGFPFLFPCKQTLIPLLEDRLKEDASRLTSRKSFAFLDANEGGFLLDSGLNWRAWTDELINCLSVADLLKTTDKWYIEFTFFSRNECKNNIQSTLLGYSHHLLHYDDFDAVNFCSMNRGAFAGYLQPFSSLATRLRFIEAIRSISYPFKGNLKDILSNSYFIRSCAEGETLEIGKRLLEFCRGRAGMSEDGWPKWLFAAGYGLEELRHIADEPWFQLIPKKILLPR